MGSPPVPKATKHRQLTGPGISLCARILIGQCYWSVWSLHCVRAFDWTVSGVRRSVDPSGDLALPVGPASPRPDLVLVLCAVGSARSRAFACVTVDMLCSPSSTCAGYSRARDDGQMTTSPPSSPPTSPELPRTSSVGCETTASADSLWQPAPPVGPRSPFTRSRALVE